MSKIIDFNDRSKITIVEDTENTLPEPAGKVHMIKYLEELLGQVKENKVDAVFCCWIFSNEPGFSQSFRAGSQNYVLLGRIESFKWRMIRDMESE